MTIAGTQDLRDLLRRAREVLTPSIFQADGVHTCDGIEDDQFCRLPACWQAEWSDRIGHYCDAHKSQGHEAYAGDHEYDQTGQHWTELPFGRIARQVVLDIDAALTRQGSKDDRQAGGG